MVALVGVVGLVVAGLVWTVGSLAFGTQPAPRVALGAADTTIAQQDGQATSSGAQPDGASAHGPVADPDPAAAATPPAVAAHVWDPAPPGLINDPALALRLDEALVGVDGRVGVAVKDLGSGRGAALNGDVELASASLYKLPVLYTVFDLGVSMNEQLPITDEALSYDSGTMELGAGEMLTVAEAVERMVTLSDNASAIMLGSLVGANRVNASLATLGMDTTHYSLERMTTSALDMLHFLDQVATGRAVSPAASADMLHILLRQRVNDRLPRLLPQEVLVAHKTGNLPGIVNDVGILYGPTTTIAVAALVSGTTDETTAASAIARLAEAAYAYFDDRPEVADRPRLPPPPSRPVPPVWREPRPVPATPTPTPAAATAGSEAATPAPTATAEVEAPAATASPPPTPVPTLPIAAVRPAVATPTPTPLPPPPVTPTPPRSAVPQPAPATRAPTRPVAPTATVPARR